MKERETWLYFIMEGWHKLLKETFSKLDRVEDEYGVDILIQDVKEKYGALIIDVEIQGMREREVRDIVDCILMDTERVSETICQKCGAKGFIHTVNGWEMTLCDSCYNEMIKEQRSADIRREVKGVSMIYITGDCHGDYTRFNTENFPEQKEMTKDDYVIICGDFGLWADDKENKYWMDWLENKPFTTLIVEGNHENYDYLNSFQVDTWNGGNVHFIRPSVIHLMRGQVFTIDGLKVFTFGGAASHDISGGIFEKDDPYLREKIKHARWTGLPYRINHLSWWKEEMPSQEEYEEGLRNLEMHNFKVDYIITHCCSNSTQAILSSGMYETNELTTYLQTIKEKVDYKHWFFGHYHEDRKIDDKDIVLYKQIVRVR